MDIISNYMITNYLNSPLKAETSLRVSSGRQRQVAANFDVSTKPHVIQPKSCVNGEDKMIIYNMLSIWGSHYPKELDILL